MGLFSKLKGDKDKKNNRNSVHGHHLPPPGSAPGSSNPSAGGSGAGLHPPSQPGPDHSSVSLVPPPHQEPPSSISQQQQQPLPQQQPPWGYSPSPNPNPQAQGQQQFWPQQGQQYGGFPQAPYGQPIYILQNGQLVPVYTGQQIGVPPNVNMASPTVVSPITNADYGFQGNQSPAPVPFSSSSYQIPPLPVPPSAPPSGLTPSLYTTPSTIPSAPPSSSPYSHPENQAVSPVSPVSDFSHGTAFSHHQPPSSTFTSAPVDPSATPPVVPKPMARKPVPGVGSSSTPISSTPPQLPLPTASVVTQGIGSLSVSDPPASSPELPKQKVQLSPQMEQKVEFLKNQGNSMVEAKDYDQAIMFYSMALDYNPESAVCLSNRSMVYTQLHPPKMKEAKEDAEAATKADPSYWKGWSRLGDALLGMGEASRAVDAYNKAVEVGGASVGQNTKHSLANAKKAAGHNQSTTTSPTTPVATQASPSGARTSTQKTPTQSSTPSLNTLFSTTSDTRATGANQVPRPAPASTTATTSTSVASSSTATQPSRTQPPPVNTQTAPPSRTPAAATATTATATTTASGSSATPASPSASAPARTTQAASGLPAVLEEAVANVEEIGNSEAPPAYAPNPSSTDPTIRHMSQQAVYSQVIELRNTLLVRNKGSFVIKPYTAVGNIDAVRIEFVGMTTQELTPRELGVHPDQHPSFSGYFVNSVLYPGCTLIDLDMEVSKIGEGRLPGTYSVSGYSEVYRSQQLETAPILPITLSSVHTLPEVTVDQIVSRMTVLKYNRLLPETNMQMYESLRKFLGPDPYPNQTDADKANLRNQITDICYVLNRVDATKYVDMSNCRHLTNNTLGTVAQGIGLKNFLFQILLGCELLVRLLKEPANATYTGLISHNISANLVIADLWMQNIDTKRETTPAGLPRHLLISLVHQRQCEGLIRFAETFKWPYMDEARNYIEGAYNDLITGKAIGFDMCDWLFGLVRPGKLFRHLIMNCLVYSSPSIRDFQGAPTFTCGLVLLNRSYWPRRSVLGGVLGGLRNLTTVCGWVGPAPKAEGIAPGWCQVDARKVTIPIPCTKSQRTAEELEEARIGPDLLTYLSKPSPFTAGPHLNTHPPICLSIRTVAIMYKPELSIASYGTEALPKPHTIYNVSIRLPLRSFSLKKRYSDFDELHKALISSEGIPPPIPLPPKSYLKSTVSNNEFAEERRRGLEEYIHAIQNNRDSRWRESPPWRQFLNLPSSTSNYESSTTSITSHLSSISNHTLTDPVLWLDAHREMKALLQDARSEISRRDQATSVADQHDASAAAKKILVKVSSLLDNLERGLTLQDRVTGTKILGDGEIRRRKDLLASGIKERNSLEALANSLSANKLQGSIKNSSEVTVTKEALAAAVGNIRGRSAGRVLGAPVSETDRTRQLDNSGVLQLQQDIMKSQDGDLEALLKAVGRQKQVGVEIGRELDEQNQLLDSLGVDVERVNDKIRVVKKRVKNIS